MHENTDPLLTEPTNNQSSLQTKDVDISDKNDKIESAKNKLIEEEQSEDHRNLEERRGFSWFKRNLSPMKFGSMRLTILIWVRMNVGMAIIIPYYFTYFGALTGIAMLFLGYVVTYQACAMIFDCADYTGIKEYFPLAQELISPSLIPPLKLSLMIDYISAFIYNAAFAWITLEYYMVLLGYMPDEWIIDKHKQQFYEYTPGLILIRGVFFIVLFLILVPLFLKKDMRSLNNLSLITLTILILQSVWILAESPFFRAYYQSLGKLNVEYFVKPPTLDWITGIFNMALLYYIQTFTLVLRNELFYPSAKRSKKVAASGIIVQFVFYAIFAFVLYISFGDNFIPINITLRLPYPGKSYITEAIFQTLVISGTVISIIGMSVYNPGIREYIMRFSTIKNERTKFVVFSLGPLGGSFLLVFFMPKVTKIIGFFGLAICNFNGYIVPALMKIAMLRRSGGSRGQIMMLYIYVTLLGIFGIAGFILGFILD